MTRMSVFYFFYIVTECCLHCLASKIGPGLYIFYLYIFVIQAFHISLAVAIHDPVTIG